MIDKQSPIPIYYQLEEYIRQGIERGYWKKGEALPSEREFAEQYGISRMTVRQAIIKLVDEGLLVRHKGRGTFVAEKKIEQPLMTLTSFSEDMRQRGMEPGTKVIDFKEVHAPLKISKELELSEGAQVYQISRIRLADDCPMAYEEMFLPQRKFEELNEQIVHQSVYEYVEQILGERIDRAYQTIVPSLATSVESELLQIEEGAPVLLQRRTSYLSDGTPFEHVKSIYRGDRYKLITEMKR